MVSSRGSFTRRTPGLSGRQLRPPIVVMAERGRFTAFAEQSRSRRRFLRRPIPFGACQRAGRCCLGPSFDATPGARGPSCGIIRLGPTRSIGHPPSGIPSRSGASSAATSPLLVRAQVREPVEARHAVRDRQGLPTRPVSAGATDSQYSSPTGRGRPSPVLESCGQGRTPARATGKHRPARIPAAPDHERA